MKPEFRAWDKKNKIMLYGSNTRIFALTFFGNPFAYEQGNSPFAHYEVDFELMQHIGLRDKNDQKVFVGDKLSSGTKAIPYLVVKYDRDRAKYMFHGTLLPQKKNFRMGIMKPALRKKEVIGHIYEDSKKQYGNES